MTGNIKELKDYKNPQGVTEDEAFMSMNFEELLRELK